MTTKRKKWLLAGCIAVVAAGCWLLLRPTKTGGITLETDTTTRITISNSVTATGTVEPVTEVEVGTQVSGIIDKLYVDYNDVVKAGQLIAEMDKVTLQAELESAQAEEASSKTEYEYQLKNYTRTRTLHEKELVSDAEYDEAFYLYEKARNAYEQAKAAMVKVERNLGYATITSPIDGVVISRAVEEGQTVAAGFETPTLFTIANDLTQMQVVADVDEADIGQVTEGQRVDFTVDAYPDDTFEGVVEQVRLEATTESSVVTYEVVITAHNPDLKLKPGLTANVTIYTLEKENALSVPTRALRFVPDAVLLAELEMTAEAEPSQSEAGTKRTVWVVNGQTLSPRLVTAGAASGDRTEIIDGLSDGDIVAVDMAAAVSAPAPAAAERSPFMPTPPGGNDKKK
ncbi:MAG TPA: efflux RND transporter periplasmic adaptor subunit [Candidatus Alistipes intestinipullorum]|nr:efflux RND transporter periplasmic adaptor subunit [Candidatus Alistipes intestinipullorum]